MFKEINELRLFFNEPNREFHLRELSRLMKKNPVTIKNHLKHFVNKGILKKVKKRHLEIYSSNKENSGYKELKRIYNRLSIIDSGFIDFLDQSFSLPTIILFGSYEKGEDNEKSDIDILILSEIKKELNIKNYENILSRPIQLHVMNKKDFEKAKKHGKDLINSIINGSIIKGFIEVL